MKFTSEDLMKAMGLNVGDRVKIAFTNFDLILEVKLDTHLQLYDVKNDNYMDIMDVITDKLEYEILPRPKRVGDLTCNDFECPNCPLNYICNLCDYGFLLENSLFNILELFNCDDQEIHDLLKARLDKEVNE